MRLASVELTAEELMALLAMAKARHAEMERMRQGLEEGEGEDLQRHRALRALGPQIQGLEDLVLKLEGAAADLRSR